MKVFVVANHKGGIGKTTTAVAMASILNKFGYKTLLIDMDPSGNATDTLRGVIEGQATLYDVILDKNPVPFEDAIQETENGFIIASDPLLRDADMVCNNDPNGFFRLKDAIEDAQNRGAIKDYEFIIIDTQPVINALMHNALVAADEVVIPITADRYPVAGLHQLADIIKSVKKRINPDLEIYGLLLVKFKDKQQLSRSVKEYLVNMAKEHGTVVLQTVIRECVAVQKAQVARMPLIKFSSSCTTELDYEDFVQLIIDDYEVKEA